MGALAGTPRNCHNQTMTDISTTAVFVLVAAAGLAERWLPNTLPGHRIFPLLLVLAAAPCAFLTIELPVSSGVNRSILLVAILIVLIDSFLKIRRPETRSI
jgi:hypothetical protein